MQMELNDSYNDLKNNCMNLWNDEALGKSDIPFALDPGFVRERGKYGMAER